MNEYVIIKKTALPKSLELVLQAKKIVDDGYSISEACKIIDISRSTYYKYSNDVFEVTSPIGRKLHILIKALNNKGVLGHALNEIANVGGNVLSINQAVPIRELAYISIMIDLSKVEKSNEEIVSSIRKVQNVKKVEILAVE